MAITTNISLHLISEIKAIRNIGPGSSLTLITRSPRYGDTSITLFFDDEGLVKPLAEAINDAVASRQEPSPDAAEQAMYDAASIFYSDAGNYLR